MGGPGSKESPEACARRCRTVEPGGPAGSSRSTTPSSAAISAASAVSSFVTEAHRKTRSRGPCVPATSPSRSTPTETVSGGHCSTCARTSTAGDTRTVERRLVPAESPMAATVGYSRAVRVGPHVHVAGTAPIMPGEIDPPPDAYSQTKRSLEIILAALEQVGARAEHVVRTRAYLVDVDDWKEVGRAHGEVFGSVLPASAFVVVKGLLDPRWRVELEADALVP